MGFLCPIGRKLKDNMRKYDNIKVAVVGMGYVGLSLAIMLAQHHEVLAVDIDSEKVKLISKKCSPFKDEYIEKYLKETELHILATTDSKNAYKEADYVVVAVPTNFNAEINAFDTSLLEAVVEDVHTTNHKAIIVIKSTIPNKIKKKLKEKYTIADFLPGVFARNKSIIRLFISFTNCCIQTRSTAGYRNGNFCEFVNAGDTQEACFGNVYGFLRGGSGKAFF